jgi:transcriptional regulator with XRE-family HTH domain
MKKNRKTINAIEILNDRYIKNDPDRRASLEVERINAEVAQTIYDLRQEKGLSQQGLADLIGTTQSVISRLEDANYEGHSLTMLSRIAKALNKSLEVKMSPRDSNIVNTRYVFQEVLKGLRREKGLRVDELAKKADISRDEILAMERDDSYKPEPRTLYKLSQLFEISQRKLAVLAGVINNLSDPVITEASNFAAKSESFANLTDGEKRTLDEFIKFLRKEENQT